MKNTARIVTLSALTCIAAQAAPFLAVGDNAELFLTASGAIKFDDNIYLDASNEQDDTIFSFTPGVDLVFGKGAAASGNVYFREEIRRYTDADSQDTELADLGATLGYDNGVTKGNFNASYTELAQNDESTLGAGRIINRDVSKIGGGLEFSITEKTSLAVGGNFDKTDYDATGYVDSDVWTLPLDLYYAATPKLDWSLGYQYRGTDLAGAGLDTDDNFFNVGARGEFSPKLKGQIRVGYTQRSFDAGSDNDLFGINGSLSYAYSDKSSYQFTIGNDFGSSAFGQSTETFSLGLTSNNRFTEQLSLSLGVNFRSTDYSGLNARSDDTLEGRVGLKYVYSKLLNFDASVTLRNNDSDLAGAEFSNNIFSFGANVRY